MKNIKQKSTNHLVDLILVGVAVYLIFTIKDWSNIEAFDQLLLMLYAMCVLLRIANMLKQKKKELLLQQKQSQEKQEEEK
ncbi:MAG TPA: hypothetical protein IAB62_07135 [Candidatus Coprocola pullicola]|nr:hypothetical protein [Candidatus Coprocola pullicola]